MAAQSENLAEAHSLLAGAVAIAMHEMPEASIESTHEQIEELVSEIRARFQSDSARAAVAHAHTVMFDERRFSCVVGEHEPLDSYLPAVLERRRGLPILLVLVYKLVLERLGVPVHGLNTPGRFFAGVEFGDSVMIVDCAAGGRVLTMRELVNFVLKQTGASSLPAENPLPLATHRDWLQRLLRNLMHCFGMRNRPTEFAAMVELKELLES